MFKKTVLSVSIAAGFACSALVPSFAQAQGFGTPPFVQNADWHGQPNDDWNHHHGHDYDHGHDHDHDHHHHNGGIIAGGLAAGIIGGVVGGAIANGGGYEEPRRCWYQNRQVENEYDPGWHYERVRVCN